MNEETLNLEQATRTVLKSIEREREQEIISRRFGLYNRKETLEQIGEMLGITRERVRQLEKAILSKLQVAAVNLPIMAQVEKEFVASLTEVGNTSTVYDLATKLKKVEADDRDCAHVAFLSTLAPRIAIIKENDDYYQSVGIGEFDDAKKLKQAVEKVVKTIKEHGKAVTIPELHKKLDFNHPNTVQALATISKHLTHLKDDWGLNKWPTVNPKNIRDKIYVILKETDKPLHFSEIAKHIEKSDFKRKEVTTQAIHNELIKDNRFVLIGRGIYALKEWGYEQGTVSDIITEILQKSDKPMHRDEIVKAVLKRRQVKETTILLNLQGKDQFKRVAKATYVYQDNPIEKLQKTAPKAKTTA